MFALLCFLLPFYSFVQGYLRNSQQLFALEKRKHQLTYIGNTITDINKDKYLSYIFYTNTKHNYITIYQ